MPRTADEVKYLLEQAQILDLIVGEFAQNLVSWSESNPIQGMTYRINGAGFTVTVFGMKLASRYEQVKDGDGQFPDLYARISLCVLDQGEHLGRPVHAILLDRQGAFSVDGTKDVRFHRGDQGLLSFGFKGLSNLVASTVIDLLPTIQ
jgi:hypothetical protein